MECRTVFGFLILAVSIPFALAGQQYQESVVLNAACAKVQMPSVVSPPSPHLDPWLEPQTGPVIFRMNYIKPKPENNYQGQYVPACEVSIPIYSAPEVNKIVDDLRDQVLKAIKTGIVQAAIKGDQVDTLSMSIQRSVESELRAGALREVTELRQELAVVTKRLADLEAKQLAMGSNQ